MARAESETLSLDGHEVTITNPGKLFFADAGITKLDLVRYYLAVADGAIVGVRDRPMALKRFVDGADGEAFFQKRAPKVGPGVRPHRRALVSLRAHGRRGRRRQPGGAGLGRQPRLRRPEPASGPLRRPRPPRRAARRPRSRSGCALGGRPIRGARRARGARGARLHGLAEDLGLARHPRLRPARASLGLFRGAALRAGHRPRGRAPGAVDRDVEMVEGGAPRRLPRLQPERQGPHGRVGLLGPASPDRPPSRRRSPGTRSRTRSSRTSR